MGALGPWSTGGGTRPPPPTPLMAPPRCGGRAPRTMGAAQTRPGVPPAVLVGWSTVGTGPQSGVPLTPSPSRPGGLLPTEPPLHVFRSATKTTGILGVRMTDAVGGERAQGNGRSKPPHLKPTFLSGGMGLGGRVKNVGKNPPLFLCLKS